MKVTVTDIVTELEDSNQVYVQLSREDTEKIFKDMDSIPKNEYNESDDSFTKGEMQFIFSKDGNLEEILVFPVYEDTDCDAMTNGDFINAPNYIYESKELINFIKSILDFNQKLNNNEITFDF